MLFCRSRFSFTGQVSPPVSQWHLAARHSSLRDRFNDRSVNPQPPHPVTVPGPPTKRTPNTSQNINELRPSTPINSGSITPSWPRSAEAGWGVPVPPRACRGASHSTQTCQLPPSATALRAISKALSKTERRRRKKKFSVLLEKQVYATKRY